MASVPTVRADSDPKRPRAVPDTRGSGARTAIVAGLLFLGTVAVFSRSLGYGFTNYDDPAYVTDNLHVRAGLTWASVRWAFAGRIDFWQPLNWLTHMADCEVYGSNAAGHHLTNILLHAINAVLVLLVMRRLTGAFWTSALAAALFAWHPLRVESVTWITERKDVMSGLFFLLTIWAYARYAGRRSSGRPAGGCYALTLAAYTLGLACKPVLVAMPGLLLLLDYWPLGRLEPLAADAPPRGTGGGARARERAVALLVEKLPFILLAAVFSVLTYIVESGYGAVTLKLSWGARIANAIVSVPRYLGKFFWPFDLTLVYSHPGSWPTGGVLAAGAVVLAITAAGFWSARRRPWILVGWGWFLLMLLPTLGIVQVGFQSIADRYTYLPMLGFELALLWTVRASLSMRLPRGLMAGGIALLLAGCVWRTWDQQGTWRDPPTLFSHAIAAVRDNYAAHSFYSVTLLGAGRVAEAEAQARRAIAINPDFAAAHNVLALICLGQGRLDDAIAGFRRVLQLTPRAAGAQRELGMLLLQKNQPDEAIVHFKAALDINPDILGAYVGLARAANLRRDPASAVAYYRQALALRPNDGATNNELAVLLADLGRFTEAEPLFGTAIRADPRNAEFQSNYARLLLDTARPKEALEHALQASALAPDEASVQLVLAHCLEQAQRPDEAFTAYARVTALDPRNAEALCGTGSILLQQRRPEAARERFAAALKVQPDWGAAYVGLALADKTLGREDDMIANLRQAIRCNPRDAAALSLLGDTLSLRRQFAEAAASYEAALRARPGDASTEARLGYALYLLHRPADAARHWEEALRLDPTLTELRERIDQARRAEP